MLCFCCQSLHLLHHLLCVCVCPHGSSFPIWAPRLEKHLKCTLRVMHQYMLHHSREHHIITSLFPSLFAVLFKLLMQLILGRGDSPVGFSLQNCFIIFVHQTVSLHTCIFLYKQEVITGITHKSCALLCLHFPISFDHSCPKCPPRRESLEVPCSDPTVW